MKISCWVRFRETEVKLQHQIEVADSMLHRWPTDCELHAYLDEQLDIALETGYSFTDGEEISQETARNKLRLMPL